MESTSEHEWFSQQIGAFLAGGLSADDRVRFDAHAQACASCAGVLRDAISGDAEARMLFADVRPDEAFEDRLVTVLRNAQTPRRRLLHPAVRLAASGVAAALVLGAVGYFAGGKLDHRERIQSEVAFRDLSAASSPPPRLMPQLSSDANSGQSGATGFTATRSNADGAQSETVDELIKLSRAQIERQNYTTALGVLDQIQALDPKNEFASGVRELIEDKARTQGQVKEPFDYNFEKQLNDPAKPKTPDDILRNPENWPAITRDETGQGTAKSKAPDHAPLALPPFFKPMITADSGGPTVIDKETDPKSFPLVPAGPDSSVRPAPATQPSAPAPATQTGRKVIRHGEMTFDVDSFDSSAMQISKIVAEEGGFIATTNSEKLPNGKVTGIITVRVPPENLDTLVLKLRGLGDLKGQKIGSDDISREYTDLESELRAARAMEDRLLDIIKTGKGQVKDLLAAEKELGIWREKAEQIAGQINYYDNLVSLSTLHISLSERDIRQAALATETENISIGIETPDVEKARVEALKAIDDAKGRIIQSDLKQFEAGQLAATIVCDVAPDSAGPIMDRLKQLGMVARLDIGRQQATPSGAPAAPGVKVDRQQTRFTISLYNLANIAPRETTNLNLACENVEKTYHDSINRVLKAGGRIVNSTLNRPTSDQIDASINFETPATEADAVLADVRAMGSVMHLTVTENPDAANVTASKRGFVMTLASLATVPPREVITRTLMTSGPIADAYHVLLTAAQSAGARISTAQLDAGGGNAGQGQLVFEVPRDNAVEIEKAVTDALGAAGEVVDRKAAQSTDTEHTVDSKIGFAFMIVSNDALSPRQTISRVLAVPNVSAAYGAILAAAQAAGSKILIADLNESNRQNVSGDLGLVVPRAGLDAVEKAIADARGGVVSRTVMLSPSAQNTTDSKTLIRLTIKDMEQLPPRQTTTLKLQVTDPEKTSADIQAAVVAMNGRVVDQSLAKDGDFSAHVVVDVPLKGSADLLDRLRAMGVVRAIDQTKDANIPDADFVRARVDVSLVTESQIVGDDAGIWASFRQGLGTSIKGLLYSLELIIIGLCLVLPWALVIWVGYRAVKRMRRVSVPARS